MALLYSCIQTPIIVLQNVFLSIYHLCILQVAEGVATAGAVIALAQKYHVKIPVLTAVARIIDNELTPKRAVLELMNLPQVGKLSIFSSLFIWLTFMFWFQFL